jgi:hypothetical protein
MEPIEKPKSLTQVLFEPRPETIIGFIAGLLLFGLSTNLLYQLLLGDIPPWPQLAVLLVALALLFFVAYGSYRQWVRKARRLAFTLEENTPSPPQRRGLIWILTPSGTQHTMVAIRHHYGDGSQYNHLRHCWLIQQRNNAKVTKERYILEEQLQAEKIQVELHTVTIDQLSVSSTYAALVQIVEEKISAEGLSPNQVVVDITGGTKPMTAGLILGALSTDTLLEYVETDRDQDGNPLPATARVVFVSRQAYLQTVSST